jgi:hypothetical protein
VVINRDELKKAVADAQVDVMTGAAATTAGIALGASPVVATAVGASAPALKLTHRLYSRARQLREDRSARCLEQAARLLDVGLDIFEERATSHDARIELLARVLEAAARTPLEEKVTALARVLAEGLGEGGSVHEALVLAAALADIEVIHVFLLHHLAVNPLPPEQLRRQSGETQRGWDRAQIVAVLPELESILDGLLAVVESHGLVRSQADSTWGGIAAMSQVAVTPLGRRCLFLLGEDVPEPQAEDVPEAQAD